MPSVGFLWHSPRHESIRLKAADLSGLDRVVQKPGLMKVKGMSVPWGKEWQLFEAFYTNLLGSLHSSWLELQKPKTMMSITVDTMFQTLMGAKNSEGGVGRKQHQ